MADFKGKNKKELVKLLNEKKDEPRAFKLGNSRSKTKNVKEGRNIRKDVARIMTELTSVMKADNK
ncbi:MAG: 50S ribosomal protein L29 [Candidatus Taylorbacteria bacterium]|nr:50S ribosomal protein L29 [Candidatus Taylorbacteria bacterium]